LDVEGYEIEVLKGLDFSRFSPSYILVETNARAAVESILSSRYEMIEQMTRHDFLYRRLK
jgi:HD superfamily phosphohydrolase